MADVDQEQQEAPVSRADFNGFMHQLGGHLNQIAAQNQQLAAQQQAIAQRFEQQTAPPPEELPQDFKQTMVVQMLKDPVDYSKRLLNRATELADQRIEQRLRAEYERSNQIAAAQNFWAQFYDKNPDLQGFHGEILATFNNTPQNEDASVRANYARDVVRQKLAQVAGSQSDADARQRAARQMAGGAPGSAAAPQGGAKGVEGYDRSKSPSEMTDDYFTRRLEQNAARSGDQLRNDREYWEEMRQSTLRRVRETGGRKGKAA